MEMLHASVFDRLLSLLTPEEACSLAVVSKTLRELVGDSAIWRDWCERDCPSLKTSPARELVALHYGAHAVGERERYKELFRKLARSRCREMTCTASWYRQIACHCKPPIETVLPKIEDFILLMDVYVNDEGLLFCSADGSELETDWRGCQGSSEIFPEWSLPWVIKAVVGGVVEEGREQDLHTAVKEVADRHSKALEKYRPLRKYTPHTGVQLLFSWKLMRKSDGRVQVLFDRELVSHLDHDGFYPERVGSDRVRYHCLEAQAPVLGSSGVKWWGFFLEVMRLRCCYNKHVEEAGASSADQATCHSQAFAVEVGIVIDPEQIGFGPEEL
jgi:hypothetical protein